jgi:peptidoglycan/LPS O-acetylase OafA/YrhL
LPHQETASIKTLRYRPELDGLRGVAVSAVVLYHARVPGFSGGYVGVDVFFVISGYLITQLLETSANQDPPRVLVEFYLRRARRLLPALFPLLIASALAALVLYLPEDLIRFGRALLFATAFLGNYGAWQDGGYFDPGWRFTPLRHLWSIGVEEQFYLLFPVFVFAVARMRPRLRLPAVAGVTMLSLLLAFWAAGRWPISNYYLLPTRGWELLIGALIAMSPQFCRWRGRVGQVLAVLSATILAATVGLASRDYFPGIQTVAACVGTALLISCNSAALTSVGRVLTWRPLVFTGLISYSLYLWHAPVLAFYSYYDITDIPGVELAGLLCAIYVVSALSWAFIEQPFRKKSQSQIRALLLRAGLPVFLALVVSGYLLMKSDGLPQRFAPQPIAKPRAPGHALEVQKCLNLSDAQIAAGELCSFGPSVDAAATIVVWGDSHASALLPAYQALADSRRLRIYYGVKGACWPLLGAEAGIAGNYWHRRCVSFNASMAQAIQRLRPQLVILNAYWLDPLAATDGNLFRNLWQSDAARSKGMERTLALVRSAGASTCAVLTVPGYPYPIPYALAMAQRRHLNPDSITISRTEALGQYQLAEGQLRTLARSGQLRVADLKDAICPTTRCLLAAPDGASLYEDANHLSKAGSRLVTPALESCIANLGP